ncbi:MAG: pseudouridine synthase [Coriobacteriales bacterium]|jgi:23S rRNA pseudouridine2605 synthase
MSDDSSNKGVERDSHVDYPMRLQKFLARAGVASRRGSENLMTAGRVTVNGEVVTELGSKVDPNTDVVAVDGNIVKWGASPVTLILNKPAGYVSTMSDPHARHTVAELVPTDRYPGLFPVGRLDMDTTGVLLFTTDGEMGHLLLSPKHHVPKVYEAIVDGNVTPRQRKMLEEGIELEDGPTLPAKVSILDHGRDRKSGHQFTKVRIVLTEGRKRQVKRMLEAVGHPVVRLHRSSFGPVRLNGLPEGAYRVLGEDEVSALWDSIK